MSIMKKQLLLFGLMALCFVACKNPDDSAEREREKARQDSINTNNKVDKCIYDIMADYYLWNNRLPKYHKEENSRIAILFLMIFRQSVIP